MKEPMEKLEKSRTLRLSILGLSAADFRIQNCKKWSLIDDIRNYITTTKNLFWGVGANILSTNSSRFVNCRNEIATLKAH